MTLLFENRDTIRFQVQEMVRIERIARPDKVREEVDVYNELLPGPEEVATTLRGAAPGPVGLKTGDRNRRP
jgi:hypothetical protein